MMIGDRSDYGFCLRHIGTYTAGGYDRKVEGDMGSQTGEKKLPEKIKVMSKAVRELIEEGADINRIKVSEITQRAGIGKGTAYEYFPNKEELISSALLYQMDEMYSQLGQQIAQKESFEESVHYVLSSMAEKIRQRDCFLRYVHIMSDNGPISEKLQQQIKEKRGSGVYLANDCIQRMVEIGRRTGEINTELPEEYIHMEVLSKMIGFAVYLAGEWETEECGREKMKELICKSLKRELAGSLNE